MEMPEEALEVCLHAIRENPNCADAHLLAGILCEHMGYDDLAYKHLRQALWIEPDNSEARRHYKSVCNRLGIACEDASSYHESLWNFLEGSADDSHSLW